MCAFHPHLIVAVSSVGTVLVNMNVPSVTDRSTVTTDISLAVPCMQAVGCCYKTGKCGHLLLPLIVNTLNNFISDFLVLCICSKFFGAPVYVQVAMLSQFPSSSSLLLDLNSFILFRRRYFSRVFF